MKEIITSIMRKEIAEYNYMKHNKDSMDDQEIEKDEKKEVKKYFITE